VLNQNLTNLKKVLPLEKIPELKPTKSTAALHPNELPILKKLQQTV